MNDLPTIKQLKIFMKDSKKTIFTTVAAVMVLFAGALAYTAYSNDIDRDLKSIESVTGQEVESITKAEYNKLQKNKVTFLFYVENEEGNPFSNANLFESFLLSPDILARIKAEIALDKSIPLEYILDVSYDDKTNGMALTVTSGDAKKNMALAELLYGAISAKELTFFDNKSVYMITEPEKVKLSNTLFETEMGVTEYVISSIAALLFAVVFGIFVACIRMFFKPQIGDVFTYKYAETDLVLDLTKLETASESAITPELLHAIKQPAVGTKLILCEKGTVEALENDLQKENSGTAGTFIVHNDITQVSEAVLFGEIIIVSKKNQTTKKWYKNQRIQLENYHSPIKIILI